MAELYDPAVRYENEVTVIAAEPSETVTQEVMSEDYDVYTEQAETVLPEAYETVTTREVYQCGDCFKLLSSLRSLQRHMLIHDPSANRPKPALKYQCETCSKCFPTPSACQRHMNAHIGFKKYQCEICMKRFSQNVHAQHHMLAAHTPGANVYKCTFEGCKRTFVVEYKLKYHMREHLNIRESKWECQQCGEKFCTEYRLKRHALCHSSTQFTCDVCGNLSSSARHLLIHKKMHTQENNYQCQVCLKTYQNSSGFRSHVQRKCGRDAYRYKCDKCMQCFFKEDSLKTHLLSHAKGRRTYVCGTCQKTYAQPRSLSKHCEASGHKALEVQVSCEVCQETFASGQELAEHVVSHTAEELDPPPPSPEVIPCRQCGETFLTKFKLLSHITSEHTKAYLCKICGERFKKSDGVRKHMKTMHSKK
ncbi:zinc finger protein 708-like [Lineus longissimus]|uniref:zinc finger protein 708-like n=1 Tax=Lineus longissimus TaxID=88925 RepID=UPI00315D8E81